MQNRFLFWTGTGSVELTEREAVGQAMPCQIIKMTMAPLLLGCMEFYDLWVRSGSQESNDERRRWVGVGVGRGAIFLASWRLFYFPFWFTFLFIFFSVCMKVAPQQLLHFLWHCHWCSCRSACWPFDKWVLHFPRQQWKEPGPELWADMRAQGNGRMQWWHFLLLLLLLPQSVRPQQIDQTAVWSLQQQMPSKSRQLTHPQHSQHSQRPHAAFQLANAIKLPLPEPPAYPYREVCLIPLSDLQQKRL